MDRTHTSTGLPTHQAARIVGVPKDHLRRWNEERLLPASGRASGERRPRLRWTLSDMCAARTAVLLHDADAVPFACTLPALAHTRSDLLSAADKIAFARLPHDGGPGGRRRWAAFVSPEAPPEGAEPVVPLGPTLLCALQQVSTLLRDQIQNPTSGGSY